MPPPGVAGGDVEGSGHLPVPFTEVARCLTGHMEVLALVDLFHKHAAPGADILGSAPNVDTVDVVRLVCCAASMVPSLWVPYVEELVAVPRLPLVVLPCL